jgi:membrane protease YdiL (CAAX protease family)
MVRETTDGHPLRRVLSLYFAILITSLAGVVAIGYCGLAEKPEHVFIEWTALGVDAVLVLAWCVAARKDLAPALRNASRLRWYALAIAGSAATFVTATLVVEVLAGALGAETLKVAEPVFEAGYGWPALLLTVCLQPAIIEELAFRGVILGGLGRILKPAEAVAVSSLMFMVLHLAPISFPHLFVMGLALGLLRLRSGSLYPGMVLHFLHNLWCVVTEVHAGP